MSPQFLTVLIAIVAVIGLSRASFAAAAGAAVAPPDPILANFEALRAEITAEFDAGKVSRKVTDERLAKLEQAVSTSRIGILPGESGKDAPKARIHSILRGIHGQRNGMSQADAWKGAELERAALSSGDDAAGGYLINPDTDPFTLSFLRPETVVGKLGVRMVSPKGTPYRLPEVTSGATGGWLGDSTAPTEDRQATALKTMNPKKYGMLVKVDRSLLSDANESVEQMLLEDMRLKMAEVADLACFTGTGANGQPKGMLTYPEFLDGTAVGAQIQAIGTNGGSLTFAECAKLIGALEDNDALKGSLAFLSHPKNRRRLKNERIAQYSGDTSGGVYLPGSPIMSDAQFQSAIGYPWHVTTALPITHTKGSSSDCSPVIFGNWADAILAKWAGTEIRPLFERGAELDQVWYVAFFRMDFIVRRLKSFKVIRDARINGL